MAGQPWALLFVLILPYIVCSETLLLPKCCPLGQSFVLTSSGLNCSDQDDDPSLWLIPIHSSFGPQDIPYNYIWKPLPCTGPGERTLHDEEFSVSTDGFIQRHGEEYSGSEPYCLEFFFDYNMTFPFFCVADRGEEPHAKFFFMGLGYFFSALFGLFTLLVFVSIKELYTLHGSIVVRHMLSFFIGSVILGLTSVRIILSYEKFTLLCASAGYAIQFFFMATFFWLNVMCFDIYWAFSGWKNLTGSLKERERKKLVLYSIYAWCTPLLILVITVAVDLSPSVPSNSVFKPQVGVDKCFFKEKTATWIYFYLPMALIIFSNIILFTFTACRIWSHRKETAVLKRVDSRKHDSSNDKESLIFNESHEELHYLPWYSDPKMSSQKYLFSLYLKLFVVMGINWVMELLSSIVGGPGYLWYFPDFTNTLQGVFIFLIFVWKKRVRRLVWAKLCACFGKKPISSSTRTPWSGSTRNTTSSDSTRTTNSVKMNPTNIESQTTLA